MTYCHVSAQIDRYLAEQDREAEREAWLDKCRAEIESRLNDGDAVQLGSYSMTKAEILSENMIELGDFMILADFATLGTETAGNLLRERCKEIVSKWLDVNLETIIAAESPDDYDDYSDAA